LTVKLYFSLTSVMGKFLSRLGFKSRFKPFWRFEKSWLHPFFVSERHGKLRIITSNCELQQSKRKKCSGVFFT